MKGDVGMSPHEKEREQGDAYTIHNPIPTSLFLSDMFLLLDEDSAGTIDSFTKSIYVYTNKQKTKM